MRVAIAEEHERAERLREELAQEGERLEAARVQREATLKQARHGLTSTARPTVLPYPALLLLTVLPTPVLPTPVLLTPVPPTPKSSPRNTTCQA